MVEITDAIKNMHILWAILWVICVAAGFIATGYLIDFIIQGISYLKKVLRKRE